jgi:hypothetical protein
MLLLLLLQVTRPAILLLHLQIPLAIPQLPRLTRTTTFLLLVRRVLQHHATPLPHLHRLQQRIVTPRLPIRTRIITVRLLPRQATPLRVIHHLQVRQHHAIPLSHLHPLQQRIVTPQLPLRTRIITVHLLHRRATPLRVIRQLQLEQPHAIPPLLHPRKSINTLHLQNLQTHILQTAIHQDQHHHPLNSIPSHL